MVFSRLCKLLSKPLRPFEVPRGRSSLTSPHSVEVNSTTTQQSDAKLVDDAGNQSRSQFVISNVFSLGKGAHKVAGMFTAETSKSINIWRLLLAATIVRNCWSMHTSCYQAPKPSKTVGWQEDKALQDTEDWELVHEPSSGLNDWVLLLESPQTDSQRIVKLTAPKVDSMQPISPPEVTDLLQNTVPDISDSLEINDLTQLQHFAENMRSRQQEEEAHLDRLNDQVIALVCEAKLALATEVDFW